MPLDVFSFFMRAKSEFKKIFEEHWQDFKQANPGYDEELYDQSVQKMLGCGDAVNGYAEYRCTRCGLDLRRVPFS